MGKLLKEMKALQHENEVLKNDFQVRNNFLEIWFINWKEISGLFATEQQV